MKVHFLIGGTQKGGTTALDHYLRAHPKLKMANVKEVHFFDNEDIYLHEEIDYSLYHRHFDFSDPGKVFGESTPIYMFWKSAPKRVFKYNPDMKWIILLRNPIDRAFSQWNMEFNRGTENLPFREALLAEEAPPQSGPQDRVRSYLNRGFYTSQIRRLRSLFPPEQLLIIKSEDLLKNTAGLLAEIYAFLGVENQHLPSHEQLHIGKYESGLSLQDRSYLKGVFSDEISDLQDLLGWNCEDWLSLA